MICSIWEWDKGVEDKVGGIVVKTLKKGEGVSIKGGVSSTSFLLFNFSNDHDSLSTAEINREHRSTPCLRVAYALNAYQELF